MSKSDERWLRRCDTGLSAGYRIQSTHGSLFKWFFDSWFVTDVACLENNKKVRSIGHILYGHQCNQVFDQLS